MPKAAASVVNRAIIIAIFLNSISSSDDDGEGDEGDD